MSYSEAMLINQIATLGGKEELYRCRAYVNRLRSGNHPISCLLSRKEPIAHSYNLRSHIVYKKGPIWRPSDM